MKKLIISIVCASVLMSCNPKNEQTSTTSTSSIASTSKSDNTNTTPTKTEKDRTKTKFEALMSQKGNILKFTDYNLPDIQTSYSTAKAKIRKIETGTETEYFYQIRNGNSLVSIESSDLVETIKALKKIEADVAKDVAANPDYLENKFITDDGFQIGYYVDKGKAIWLLKLERIGSDNTIFTTDVSKFDTALDAASKKIDELKK